MARGFWGGLMSSVGIGNTPAPATPGGPPDPANDWWWVQGTRLMSSAGIAVTEDSAIQLDVVQGILRELSGTIAALPGKIFKGAADDPGRKPVDHPLAKVLFKRPNAEQTPHEFWGELTIHLAWWKNAYCRILPGADYAVGALEQIHPGRLQKIERRADGRKYFTFSRLAPLIGSDTYRDDEIWHIRLPQLTPDGLRALSMVEQARDTFGKCMAVELFGALYFKNGGGGGGFFEHPGKFNSKEDRDFFLESIRADGVGLNRHKDRLLQYGVKYTANKVANDEAQFIETIKECGIKLCRLWNMPPHKMGILDKATLNNIAQQATEYVTDCVVPLVTAMEQAIDRDLIVDSDADEYSSGFNLWGLLRGDFLTRNEGYTAGRQWGWYSANDVRRMEGLPPIGPQGDIYLTPANMNDAEDVADGDVDDPAPPPSPQQPKPGAPSPDGDTNDD